jgi:ribosomal protein L11 methyltransferase
MYGMPFVELTLIIPEDAHESLVSLLTSKGSIGFIEEDTRLIAYFPATFPAAKLAAELRLYKEVLKESGREDAFDFSLKTIPDQDWNESWKKEFKPLDVGERFTILPPWEERRPGRINLIIDPGMAFGTGHHETTRSCLVLMEKYESQLSKDRFLDIGCGTGLLAIAASKLGFQEILAVDTDPLATKAARMNGDLNAVLSIDIREGSITAAEGNFDCITANIISGVLVLMADQIAGRLKHNGAAILSGILSEQTEEVVAAAFKAGLRLVEKYPDGKWVSLVLEHQRAVRVEPARLVQPGASKCFPPPAGAGACQVAE